MRHPAYNLKVNKEADRAVMIETIRRIIPLYGGNEADYRYIGFGGPFLEDMKRMHASFPSMKLVSIESDEDTKKRQEFHRFTNKSNLELLHVKSHDYFRNHYTPHEKDIIWLDYLKLGKQELSDFVLLATKVSVGSMIRITVRGEWKDQLPGAAAPDEEWEKIFQKFRNEFGDLAPENLEKDNFLKGDQYTALLTSMIVSAARDELKPPLPRYFQPLVANFYKDETRMVSVMGVVAKLPARSNQKKIGGVVCDKKFYRAFSGWDLASLDGGTAHLLDVPPLSVLERMTLDRHLPACSPDHTAACVSALPYRLGGNENSHKLLIGRYASLSPYYAQFARLAF